MKVKLKEVCKVDWGNTKLTKNSYVSTGDYLGVSAAGCDGRMNYYDYEVGTCVISAIGVNCGRMFYPNNNFVAIKNTITLNPKDDIVGKYLYYSLINNKIPKRGGAQPFISKNDTKNHEIKLYPKLEQHKIVSQLDKINEAIENRKKAINDLDKLLNSKFNEVINGVKEIKKLSNFTTLITKGASPKWQGIKYVNDDNQVLFITSENVGNNQLLLGKPKYVELKFNEIQKRSILKKGDILLNIVGASIGRAALYNIDNISNINQAVALIRTNNKINKIYLSYFLNSEIAKNMYKKMEVTGARANLSLQNVNDLQIIFPNLDNQNDFGEFAKRVDNQKQIIQQDIKDLESLLESKMHEYFD